MGEIAAILAAACWAASSVLFARAKGRTRPLVLNVIKAIVAIACLGVILLLSTALGRAVRLPDGRALAVLALSAWCGITIGDTCFFMAMRRIGVRKATLLTLLCPIFAAGFTALLGGGLPGLLGALGIGVTLLGVALVVAADPAPSGDRSGSHPPGAPPGPAPGVRRLRGGVAVGVLAALANAIGIVLTKHVIADCGVVTTAFVRQAAALFGLLCIETARQRLAGMRREVRIGMASPAILIASVLGAVLGFTFFQISIEHASPPVTAALSSTTPLFVAPIAVVWLNESLPPRAAWGTVIAVVGVAFLMME